MEKRKRKSETKGEEAEERGSMSGSHQPRPAAGRERTWLAWSRSGSFHHGGSWARTISESKKSVFLLSLCLCVCMCVWVCESVSVLVCLSVCVWCVSVCLSVCLRRARSLGELWWRLAVILTGKSSVMLGERDERLIEPSGSWFPPQCSSG